jgi:hypothetical protein
MENKHYEYIYLGERRVIKGKNYPIENEVWREHPEFPLMVSNFGKIFSMKRNKVCKQSRDVMWNEYRVKSTSFDYPNGKWLFVKVLVYQCFGENPDILEYGLIVSQKNGRIYDNSIDNLKVISQREYFPRR